jgi:medium-chain acyl-[acyl-carrier-protein] hydrolase
MNDRLPAMNPWIIRPRPNPRATLHLVCFPYAGAGASTFRTWPDRLADHVEVLAVELPGRESRFKEPPFDQLGPLVAAVTDALASELPGPFAIYGHSMGALLGFSVVHELRRRSRREPVHLFVSGRRAPQLPDALPMHQLSRRDLLDRLRLLGGVPDAVLRNTELMDIFLPILRADIAVSEAKTVVPDAPLGCPITALGGVADPRASLDELQAWSSQTTAAFDCEMFPGGHFFIHTASGPVLDLLSRRLAGTGAVP